jgi:hypothetical protein
MAGKPPQKTAAGRSDFAALLATVEGRIIDGRQQREG